MQKLRYHNTAVWWNLIIICVLLVSCGQKPVKISLAERKSLDSIISSSRNLDTLSMLQKRMESEGNMLGSVIAYKEMGKIMRNDSQFDDALRLHSEGLKQAEAIGDTLEMVQALNNIGTDYRRMGVLDLAQDYHYRAWTISKEWHDTSYDAKKTVWYRLTDLAISTLPWAITHVRTALCEWLWRVRRSCIAIWGKPSTTPTLAPYSAIGVWWIRHGCTSASRWSLTST